MQLIPRIPRLPGGGAGFVAAIVIVPFLVAWFVLALIYRAAVVATAAIGQRMVRSANPEANRRGQVLLRRQKELAVGVVVGVVALGVAVNASTSQNDPRGAVESQTATTGVPSEPLPAPSRPASPISPAPDAVPAEPNPPSPKRETPAPASDPGTNPLAQSALKQLSLLKVVDRPRPSTDYDRDAFGSGWVDVDRNGCNQRDDVLVRDAVPGTLKTGWQGRCGHDVLAGTWIDPYTGRKILLTDMKELHQSMAVQIDHIVPLAEAWMSGASEWSKDERRLFANNLEELLAVDGPTNQSKGDDDPAAWRPRKGFQCAYAKRWIGVKSRWELAVDSSEVQALREMLGYC